MPVGGELLPFVSILTDFPACFRYGDEVHLAGECRLPPGSDGSVGNSGGGSGHSEYGPTLESHDGRS
jgi:hypothetical protein